MKIFKSLNMCAYKGNDRLPLKLIQVDSVDGKLRLTSSNGVSLACYIFKKIKNDKIYYATSKMISELSKEDSFSFKKGKLNDFSLIKDGESVKLCDTETKIGSWSNKDCSEHFPNVDSVIPSKFFYSYSIDRKELYKAIKGEDYVSLKFSGNKLYVYSSKYHIKSYKVTKSSKHKACLKVKELSGNDVEEILHFDAKILKATLTFPYNDITIGFNNRVSAFGIYYESEKINIKNLAMPMFSRD